jgi:hypothetical protein
MTNSSNAVGALLIYSISLSLALVVGYILAAGSDFESIALIVLVVGALCLPALLRVHRELLFLSWNSTLGTYFLPGQAPLWLSLAAVSLLLTLVDRTLHRDQPFATEPVITWPLMVFAAVVLVTMLARGGVGIQWMGASGLSGGRKYVWIYGACLGYFALTGREIPVAKAPLICGLFFLGGLTGFVGPLAGWLGGSVSYIQYVFAPVEGVLQSESGFRVKGMVYTGTAIVSWLLARYGFGGVFHEGRFWRLALLGFGLLLGLLSGFRTTLIGLAMTLMILFFLEGHYRTPRLLTWLGGGLLGMVLLIPLTPHLPTPVQRSLAFLPLPVDQMVKFDAESTVQWREGLWGALLQDVPQYFWLGKGLTISTVDMEWSETIARFGADQWYASYLTGEHHNGFLSVIISFGIWGMLAFFWLIAASFWVLARNYREGRTELRSINAYLLASFITWNILFFSYAGTLYWVMKDVTGVLALSVALNGGAAIIGSSAPRNPVR